MKLDHIGIAVKSLDSAIPVWERSLNVKAGIPEIVCVQKVRVVFLGSGGSQIELLEPVSPESTISKFIEKRGEGLHHVAFEVPDLVGTLENLKSRGYRLIDETPRPGARGHLVAFAHPSAFLGVLTEFVQPVHT